MSTVAMAVLSFVGALTLFAGAMMLSLKAACRDEQRQNRLIDLWDETEWLR